MSTLTIRDRILQKTNMKSYLQVLSTLTCKFVHADALNDLEEAIAIRQKIRQVLTSPAIVHEGEFSDLHSDRFIKFVQKLQISRPTPIMVWTVQTIYCGALSIPSIDLILDFNFEEIFNTESLITFITNDPRNSLLLDFELSRNNEKLMKIEVQGPSWGSIAY
jgi:hypothetical protein